MNLPSSWCYPTNSEPCVKAGEGGQRAFREGLLYTTKRGTLAVIFSEFRWS